MKCSECIKKIIELEKIPEKELKYLLNKIESDEMEKIITTSVLGGSPIGILFLLEDILTDDKEEVLLKFVLELKQLKSIINDLKSKNTILLERISYLEGKQSNIDEIVQKKYLNN